MPLQVIGAGLPRTATSSLTQALEHLLGGRCNHMSAIPGHPFNLGPGWRMALAGDSPDWESVLAGYVAAVDWPASHFWRDLSAAYPDALLILSTRDSAETWLASMEATVLPAARLALAPAWGEDRDLATLFELFTGDHPLGRPRHPQSRLRTPQRPGPPDSAAPSPARLACRAGLGADLPRPRSPRAGSALPLDQQARELGLMRRASALRTPE